MKRFGYTLLFLVSLEACSKPAKQSNVSPRVGSKNVEPNPGPETPTPSKPNPEMDANPVVAGPGPKPGTEPVPAPGPGPNPPPAPTPALNLQSKEFKNPIQPFGADPWVVEKDGWYYYLSADGDAGIYLSKSRQLSNLRMLPEKKVWTAPKNTNYSKETWAPEMHFLQGRWYIYFAADDGDNKNHRMFVLESKTEDGMSDYVFKGELKSDGWAIDGTPLEHNGKLYFVWSGWPGPANSQQNLYIAPMENPWTIKTHNLFRGRHEAEDAALTNASARQAKNASSGRAVGKIDYQDSSVTFTANVPVDEEYAIEISYANGSPGRATHKMSANGGPESTVTYPPMGWDNWQTVTYKIKLNKGENKIRFSLGDHRAELDAIEIKTAGYDRVVITVPENDWERNGGPPYVNEGPQILKNGNKTMIIYSGAGSWSDHYCLGQMTLVDNDPMWTGAWKKEGLVFASANDVWGPGHASFTKSPDGQNWIVYHAAKKKGSGWDRNVRTQPFTWKADGSPDFGQPKNLNDSLTEKFIP